jgi:hypothetical protein
VDSYGSGRYFELGRDAAIEYEYLDLRFRNPHATSLLLRMEVCAGAVRATMSGTEPRTFCVSFGISAPEPLPALPGDAGRFRVRTLRIVTSLEGSRRDDLGWSVHRVPAAAADG